MKECGDSRSTARAADTTASHTALLITYQDLITDFSGTEKAHKNGTLSEHNALKMCLLEWELDESVGFTAIFYPFILLHCCFPILMEACMHTQAQFWEVKDEEIGFMNKQRSRNWRTDWSNQFLLSSVELDYGRSLLLNQGPQNTALLNFFHLIRTSGEMKHLKGTKGREMLSFSRWKPCRNSTSQEKPRSGFVNFHHL